MDEIRRLLARGAAHRPRLWLGMACCLIASAFGAIIVLAAERVMKVVVDARELAAAGLLGNQLLLILIGLPALGLVKGLADYGARYLIASAAQGTLADLRRDLFGSLIARPVSFLARHHVAELASRVTNDVQRIELTLSLRLSDLLVSVPFALGIVAVLWLSNWRLAMLVTVVIPLAGLLVRRWLKRIRAAARTSQERTASLATVLGESLGGIRIVKSFRGEDRERTRFDGFNTGLRRSNILRALRTMALSAPILEVLGAILVAVLVTVGAREVGRGRIEPEVIVAFVVGMTQFYQQTKKANAALSEMQQGAAAARRCFDLLDEGDREPVGRVEAGPLRDAIELHDAFFAYGEAPVLDGLSLRIGKGEVVALVGESGSGKTTLASLLLRFHDVTAGSITWDDTDLRELTPASVRRQIALVTQDVVVFDDTVARNIAYGEGEPDMSRVTAAARAAHAEEFILELELGYQTPLGQNGSRLSGGQRQRIAIARALYKDAPVLILDEATSSLDAHSESLVQDALARLMEGRTVLVVAHRLATVRGADRIAVIDGGRVVEQGSHDELVGRDSRYRDSHRLQGG